MDKIRPYIKLDLEIAKMEIENKQLEACFGRYIAYKENLQRINKNNPLPRGQFYLTARNVYEDLKLSSTREASRLIKLFETHGIIRAIFKSNSKKKPSIYSYITVESDSDNETVVETVNETEVETSKKEYIKRNNKNNNSAQNAHLAEDIWKLYPYKKGKARAMKKLPNLIKRYGFQQIKNTVARYRRYVEYKRDNGFKALNFQNGDTFFANTYQDYLDKNYKDHENDISEGNVQMFDFDD